MVEIISQTGPSILAVTTSVVSSSSMFCPLNSPMSSFGILSGSSPWWLVVPNMLPLEIPKFNEKPGEDPSTHVITYHLWCSSKSLNDDSVRLLLFQHTLTSPTAQ